MTSLDDQYYESLKRCELLSRADLDRYQQTLLTRLLAHAAQEVPYYKAVLTQDIIRNPETHWHTLPILTREKAQALREALYAETLPAAAGAIIEDQTSGSTGRPFKHRHNDLLKTASVGQTRRLHDWFKLDGTRSLAIITAFRQADSQYPEGDESAGWHSGAPAAPFFLLTVETYIHHQVEWLCRKKPAYLLTLPSNLHALAEHCLTHQITLSFDTILTTGEIVNGTTRELIQRAFGCRIADSYGAQEVGTIAIQCPHSGLYHCADESQMVEILDENDTPVQDGETGRVVVTSLYNYAMPLIRYDIGDYAQKAETPCTCGRMHLTLQTIHGRRRNMLTFEDGSRIWPNLYSVVMERYFSFTQFQFIQHSFTDLELRYVSTKNNQQIDINALRSFAKERLHPSVELRLTRVESLERSPSGKFEDYQSHV